MAGGVTRCAAILSLLLLALRASADTVTMTSGRDVRGVVLREDERTVTVALDYGTISFPRTHVAKVTRDARPAPARIAVAPVVPRAQPKQSGPRIPSWLTAVKTLTAQPWAHDFHQIPATVIDVGVMKNVPYQSFKCDTEYEVNVYGDPDAPAAIEVGVYRELLKDPKAKENCVAFVAAVLGDPIDAQMLRLLDRKQDLVVRKGLSIEITPETAEDAYGGWWVSVYDEEALEKVRASQKEIEQISVERVARQTRATPPKGKRLAPEPAPALASARSSDDDLLGWSLTDMEYSRPPKVLSGGGGGRVYVRGYHRKDGTYVRAHTRGR